MKDIVVYLNEDFLRIIADNQVGFFEFVADLEGIFGSWNGIVGYEPMKDLTVLSGNDLVSYNLPKKMRTILKLKKLVLKYGMVDSSGNDNFVFAKDKHSAKEFFERRGEGTEGKYVCWTDLKEKLRLIVLKAVVEY